MFCHSLPFLHLFCLVFPFLVVFYRNVLSQSSSSSYFLCHTFLSLFSLSFVPISVFTICSVAVFFSVCVCGDIIPLYSFSHNVLSQRSFPLSNLFHFPSQFPHRCLVSILFLPKCSVTMLSCKFSSSPLQFLVTISVCPCSIRILFTICPGIVFSFLYLLSNFRAFSRRFYFIFFNHSHPFFLSSVTISFFSVFCHRKLWQNSSSHGISQFIFICL